MNFSNYPRIKSSFEKGLNAKMIEDRKSVLIYDGSTLGYAGMEILIYPSELRNPMYGSNSIVRGFSIREFVVENQNATSGFVIATKDIA